MLISTALGASLYDKDRKRIKVFSLFCSLVDDISTGIRYTGSSVEEILMQCAENSSYTALTFLQQVKREIQSGGFTSKTLKTSLLGAMESMNVGLEEIEPIMMMADKLGTTDTQGQLQMLAVCRAEIEAMRDKASRKSETVGKMYISLGFLLGLGAAVILA